MLQKKLSTLLEPTLLACQPFLYTKDPGNLLTYLSTPLYQFFLLCPPMLGGYQDLPQLQQAALPLMMFCP